MTKPLRFQGKELEIIFSTSAAGSVRVELQDESGKPIPGFELQNSRENIGNELDHVVTWKSKSNVESLAGTPVRLRFVLKDADLYSFKFD